MTTVNVAADAHPDGAAPPSFSAEALIRDLLGPTTIDTTQTRDPPAPGEVGAGRLIRLWQGYAERPHPSPQSAEAAFIASVVAHGDLTPRQAARLVRPGGRPPEHDGPVEVWLDNVVQHVMSQMSPWLQLWIGYVRWILDWCSTNEYPQVIFLCRDALPLYAIARGLRGDHDIRLLHASRRSVEADAFTAHYGRCVEGATRTAFVDTGCYGSLLPTLLQTRTPSGCFRDPAVFFFFSRNPRVFGYMNHLMSHVALQRPNDARGGGALDFVIYAGDVLESLPKPYELTALSRTGEPRARIADLLSFSISAALLARLPVVTASSLEAQTSVREHAIALYERSQIDRSALWLDGPAPKVASPGAERALAGPALPPQDQFFGARCGG